MALEDLKPYQFTSEKQPPKESKRVPKWKTRLKQLLIENYDEISQAIISKSKEGSIKHIEFLRDWLYGKVKEEVDLTGDINIKVDIKDDEP